MARIEYPYEEFERHFRSWDVVRTYTHVRRTYDAESDVYEVGERQSLETKGLSPSLK